MSRLDSGFSEEHQIDFIKMQNMSGNAKTGTVSSFGETTPSFLSLELGTVGKECSPRNWPRIKKLRTAFIIWSVPLKAESMLANADSRHQLLYVCGLYRIYNGTR